VTESEGVLRRKGRLLSGLPSGGNTKDSRGNRKLRRAGAVRIVGLTEPP
jgi:hypothetical protein